MRRRRGGFCVVYNGVVCRRTDVAQRTKRRPKFEGAHRILRYSDGARASSTILTDAVAAPSIHRTCPAYGVGIGLRRLEDDVLRFPPGAAESQTAKNSQCSNHHERSSPPNESRLSCGALKKDSFLNLRAPSASSACQAARSPKGVYESIDRLERSRNQ